MSYHINAWLERGQARLAIVDADSNHLRMAWSGSRPTAELHGLFRELMLLSAAQQMGATEGGGKPYKPPR